MSLEIIGLILGARTGGHVFAEFVFGFSAKKLGVKKLVVTGLAV
jgi:hypothetical protein